MGCCSKLHSFPCSAARDAWEHLVLGHAGITPKLCPPILCSHQRTDAILSFGSSSGTTCVFHSYLLSQSKGLIWAALVIWLFLMDTAGSCTHTGTEHRAWLWHRLCWRKLHPCFTSWPHISHHERKGLKLLQGGLDRISEKMSSLEGWSGTGTQGSGGFSLFEMFKNPVDVVLRDIV